MSVSIDLDKIPATARGSFVDVPDPRRMVFVFGSNREGVHGRGAAAHARQWYGAVNGTGEGPTGDAYALPTKKTPYESLPVEEIAGHVERFLDYAGAHPDRRFMVTRVGCGLAGLSDDQIEPLFAEAPENCALPGVWRARRDPDMVRLVIAGGRDFPARLAVDSLHWLNFKTQRLQEKYGRLEEVCGAAAGADQFGHFWADCHGLPVARFPVTQADWQRYGRAGGIIRNSWMAWYGTHLVAFWDGTSPGTRNMIETATNGGLAVGKRSYRAFSDDAVFRYDPGKGPRETLRWLLARQDQPAAVRADTPTPVI